MLSSPKDVDAEVKRLLMLAWDSAAHYWTRFTVSNSALR
jgi:hypothetical protein